MTTKTELAGRSEAPQSIADLEQSFAIAVRQRELLEEYIRERLTPGKHFYQVAGSKNSLTKEGAELICLPHGYRPSYFKEGGPDQPPEDDSPYQITVRCQLRKGESFAGEGIGSASSHVTRREGQRVPRQPDPGLRHNATLKMAQKSAYIAATLNATAASEFFTQDMEDATEGSAAPHSAMPSPAEFMCPEHKMPFSRHEKDGKVWYSHKTPKGKWCNREDVQKAQPPESTERATEPAQAQETLTLHTLGDLYTAGRRIGYQTKKDMLAAIGVADDTLIGADLDAAFQKLQEHRP